jgi:large subunit ribosomal protein L23
MKIFDKFSGKKEAKPKKAPKTEENVLDMVKDEQPKKAVEVKLKEDTGTAHRILHNYHLSEKTNQFSNDGRYVFRVAKNANKITVKKAVESVYDVHVANVNILNTPGKVRRQGRTYGRTSDWKKAIVTLKPGEKITGLAEGV